MKSLTTAIRDMQNSVRPYVIINPMLAKHLPIRPSDALEYFAKLAVKTAATCKKERVLIIGFAETATAIGVAVAMAVDNAVYVHTTREYFSANKLVSNFLEEHSHAKNQALYLNEDLKDLSQYERIIFVEDEITTGKTILNFLQSVNYNGKITVSALVFNGLDETVFSQYETSFVCLQRVGYVISKSEIIFNSGEIAYYPLHIKQGNVSVNKYKYIELSSLPNLRLGVHINKYIENCKQLSLQLIDVLPKEDVEDKEILVIGTEEFMFPALMLGSELEKAAKSVKSQSTTRSRLLPKCQDKYPLHSRLNFSGVYDNKRTTYLYNMQRYDTVIVITDSPNPNAKEFLRAIQDFVKQNIYFVRIKDAY